MFKTMEFKGTKDWKIVNEGIFGGDDNYQKITGGCGFYNEEFPQRGFDLSGYVSKENILLMQKAPEMLDMLRIYLADLNNIIPPSDAQRNRIQDVEQLIKEATEILTE